MSYQEFLLFLGKFVIKLTGFNDLVVNVELEAGTSILGIFNTFFSNKAQDVNSFCLTNTRAHS